MSETIKIHIDADGCPVKNEIAEVASRHGIEAFFVSNSPMRLPPGELTTAVVVGGQFDAADDWIVEHVAADDIVVTSDIPLAARCLAKNARVLNSNGRVFAKESIGNALADRELLSQLRNMGVTTGGPAPFSQRSRSQFLQNLNNAIQASLKTARRQATCKKQDIPGNAEP